MNDNEIERTNQVERHMSDRNCDGRHEIVLK